MTNKQPVSIYKFLDIPEPELKSEKPAKNIYELLRISDPKFELEKPAKNEHPLYTSFKNYQAIELEMDKQINIAAKQHEDGIRLYDFRYFRPMLIPEQNDRNELSYETEKQSYAAFHKRMNSY